VPTQTVTVPGGGATVNALNVTSTLVGAVVTPGTVTGTGTLTVTSGAILTSGGAIGRIDAPIAFPSGVEGVLHLQQTTVFANTVSGDNGVTKTGGGQWAIVENGNSSTYTGVTTLQGGVTTFTGNLPADGVTPSAFGISTSPIVLQPGAGSMALRAQGNVVIDRNLLVENYDTGTPTVGTPTIAGFGNAVGSETVVMNGNIVLNRNLRLEFDPTPLATINGVISGTGQLSDAFGSGQILNASNSFSGGINGTSGVYLAGNDFAFGSGPIYGAGSVNATGGLVALPQLGAVNGPKTIANTLIFQRGMQFSGSETVTYTGEVNLNSVGLFFVTGTAPAIFTGNLINGGVDKQGSGTMILASASSYPSNTIVRAGTLQVGNGGTSGVLGAGAVSLTGGTLAFNRSDSIVVPNNMAGTTVATTGSVALPATSGQVTLSGSLSNINVSVAGGELRTVQPLISTNGAISVTGGKAVINTGAAGVDGIAARVTAASAVTGGVIEIAGSGKTVVTGALTVGSGGFVDLKANDLIVLGGNVAGIRSLVAEWLTGDGGLPGDTGLGSSEAFYTVDGAFATLAVYDNSGTGGSATFTNFNGIAVAPTDVLVKYTYRGDTDLNGIVDATDIANVLKGLQGLGTGWAFGDVNYDGVVDFFDLGLAQTSLLGQGAPLGRAAGFGGGIELGGGVIPEPASLGLILAAAPLMSRRRR
jgi:autotransporter-associated beta strand protein